MKFLDEMKKKIKDRSNLMKVQEAKNEQLRKEIKNLGQSIEVKELKYKQTLDSSLLDEIARINEDIEKLSNQLEYQERLLEEAKKQKLQVDLNNMLEEAKEQAREIDLNEAIENIELAKQAYLEAITQAIDKANRINELFKEIKNQEEYLTLDAQKALQEVWGSTLCIKLPSKISEREVSDLDNQLYSTTLGYRPTFRKIEKQKEQEWVEERKRTREEFEKQVVINNKMYGRGKYDF
ncbi:hypothetical protein [Niameybacter massiliensis]|uniref:hypothetical protein n=1 Tax=Niameybacter massiliensis TaxID=1658108 RepID=UPI0006B67000|nr:hypothetical protein [Niameybacter massiliensis]